MADFNKYLPKLLTHEGGYVNDPLDKGSCTNMGITIFTLEDYRNKPVICQDVKNLTKEEAGKIYKKNYWDKVSADNISSQSVAEFLFDYGVNSGINKAAKSLQSILGVVQDGNIGPKTIKAVNEHDPQKLFNGLKQNRIDFLNSIVRNNPSQKRFLNGWMNRVNSFTFSS